MLNIFSIDANFKKFVELIYYNTFLFCPKILETLEVVKMFKASSFKNATYNRYNKCGQEVKKVHNLNHDKY